MGSNGRVTIPNEVRSSIIVGEKLILVRDGNFILIEKASKVAENLKKDFEPIIRMIKTP